MSIDIFNHLILPSTLTTGKNPSRLYDVCRGKERTLVAVPTPSEEVQKLIEEHNKGKKVDLSKLPKKLRP